MAPVVFATLLLLPAILLPASPSTLPLKKTTKTKTPVATQLLATDRWTRRNHAYWFRRLFDEELSPRETECARNATVLHAASGRCAWLFEQGPCSMREWLVLGAEGQGPGRGTGLRAVCRPRPCAPGYGFLAQQRRCAREEDLCAADRAFRYSLRGEGHCHCTGFRALGPDGECHLLFGRGPCSEGMVLVPKYTSLDSSSGTCVQNPCEDGHLLVISPTTNDLRCLSQPLRECLPVFLGLYDSLVGLDVPICDYNKQDVLQRYVRPYSKVVHDYENNTVTVYSSVVYTATVHSLVPFDWSVEEGDGVISAD